jgi:hypothetical protein
MFGNIKKILVFVAVISIALVSAGASRANAIKPWGQITDVTQRFVVLTDFSGKAVLDRSTGLIWDRDPEGGNFTWELAQRRCIFIGAGGSNTDMGWRLPKVEELFSLFQITGANPGGATSALVPGHPFIIPTLKSFWSASTVPLESGETDQAYYATDGGNFGLDFKSGSHGVWCVRGGAN